MQVKRLWISAAALLLFLGALSLTWRPLLIALMPSDTQYAPGYTEAAFDKLQLGDTETEVLAALGPPLNSFDTSPHTSWLYCGPDHPGYAEDGGLRGTLNEFTFGEDGRVTSVFGQVQESSGMLFGPIVITMGGGVLGIPWQDQDFYKGKSQAEILADFGPPTHSQENRASRVLVYSVSPSSANYRWRRIGLDRAGQVAHKDSYFYWD